MRFFFDKYKSLYNSVSYSHEDMNTLQSEIESMIKNNCSIHSNVQKMSEKSKDNHFHVLHRNELIDAVETLKSDKKEDSGLFTNHLKHATAKFHTLLNMFFNALIRHGIAPDELLLGKLFPLIKNSGGN